MLPYRRLTVLQLQQKILHPSGHTRTKQNTALKTSMTLPRFNCQAPPLAVRIITTLRTAGALQPRHLDSTTFCHHMPRGSGNWQNTLNTVQQRTLQYLGKSATAMAESIKDEKVIQHPWMEKQRAN